MEPTSPVYAQSTPLRTPGGTRETEEGATQLTMAPSSRPEVSGPQCQWSRRPRGGAVEHPYYSLLYSEPVLPNQPCETVVEATVFQLWTDVVEPKSGCRQ